MILYILSFACRTTYSEMDKVDVTTSPAEDTASLNDTGGQVDDTGFEQNDGDTNDDTTDTAEDILGQDSGVNDTTNQVDTAQENNNRPDTDSDGDGLLDEIENQNGTDPNNPDTDGDGLSDGEEASYGTDPNNTDTDGDGQSDSEEISTGSDPLTEETPTEDTGLWDWGEPTVDASALAGNYSVQFRFQNQLTGYLLCESILTVTLQADGTLYANIPCITANGSTLNIEQDFHVYNVVDYGTQYGYGYNYIYGYLQGLATVTVPNGSQFSNPGQTFNSGSVTQYNGTKSISLWWTVDITTPTGLKTYQGSLVSY